MKAPERMRWNPVSRRWAAVDLKGKGREREDDEQEQDGEGEAQEENQEGAEKAAPTPLPTKGNPVVVTVYGQLSNGARSYQSAICEPHILCSVDPALTSACSLLATCV